MIALAILLTLLAVASWAIDFGPAVRDFVWIFADRGDLLFGAGLCTGFTLAASAAWAGVLLRMLFG